MKKELATGISNLKILCIPQKRRKLNSLTLNLLEDSNMLAINFRCLPKLGLSNIELLKCSKPSMIRELTFGLSELWPISYSLATNLFQVLMRNKSLTKFCSQNLIMANVQVNRKSSFKNFSPKTLKKELQLLKFFLANIFSVTQEKAE